MRTEESKGPIFTTRTGYVEAGRASDEGSRHAMVPDARAPYSFGMREAMVEHLVERGFRTDVLITVHPVGLTPQSLARKVARLLGYYRDWWGKRHAVGPDREPVWFDFVIVAALTGDQHESHAHVVLDTDLTQAEIRRLADRAEKWGMPLVVTGNRADWFSGKSGVDNHRCKIEYAIEHMLRAGSVIEIGETERLEFVPRMRRCFRAWKV